ncbi:MAG: glycosyltransferase family 1 protein, partial [Chitinophagaceae bacterium]|nr:glycosyltransferase family 1 protein [Chitinophagaceae bacterium]
HASPLATLGGVDSGGQNVYVAELAKHLAQLGFSVDVYTRWESLTEPRVIAWLPGVRIIHVKAGPLKSIAKEELLEYMPDFRNDMLDFIIKEGITYSMIHANFFMSAYVASEIKKILKIPYVVTFHALGHVRRIHQGDNDKFPIQRIKIEEEAIKSADKIIAECPQDRDDLMQYYDANPSKISIIPCGFNPEEFYPVSKSLCRSLLNIKAGEKILLQLGRMVPRKGVDNVIRALGRLKRNQALKCRLIVVGGDSDCCDPLKHPEILRLKSIAAEEGVEDTVIFAGPKERSELKYYYSAADLFITTPWYEPFGITPLEAMACGTPVIGANVGGIKYSVEDGKTGFLVPPDDPTALAEKVEEVLADNLLLSTLKSNAVNRVNAMFTWEKVALQMKQLYVKTAKSLVSTRQKDVRAA